MDAVTGLPESFSGVFNTRVTDTNVPTVLSKLQKWGDYESYGEPVGPSRFIPMKTPLSPTLLADLGVRGDERADDLETSASEAITPTERTERITPHVHTLPGFLAAQKRRGRDVGLVIDLSNHDCLYSDGILETGVRRVHVRNVAKSVPGVDAVAEVIETARAFWNDARFPKNAEKYVAIHCAYGFNRTGGCAATSSRCAERRAGTRGVCGSQETGVKHERFREALRRRYPSDDDDRDVEETRAFASSLPGDGAADASGDAPAPPANNPELANDDTLDLDIAVAAAEGGKEGEG